MDAATPLGHGPMREALVEVARQESNERWVDPGIDVDAVHSYLSFLSVPDPVCIYRGVRKLPAGHTLTLRAGRPELRARATNALIRMLQEGTIKVPIYERIHLAEAPRAHRVFESGEVMGKLIMKP